MSWASTTLKAAGPARNPKDKDSSPAPTELNLQHAKLTAFGSTRFAKNPVDEDRNVRALVEAGHAGRLHLRQELGSSRASARSASPRKRISCSSRRPCGYLKDHGNEVVYDAEHFFDGYIANPDYALQTLEAAQHAGADVLCLCDTNGGTLTGAPGRDRRRSAQALRWRDRHPHA